MTRPPGFTRRAGVVVGLAALAGVFYTAGVSDYLARVSTRANWSALRESADDNLPLALLTFVAVYVCVTALSLPFAATLTLLGGALFGRWLGAGAAALGATLGATAAMLASRFVLRDWVAARFGHRLGRVNRGVERDGAYYLLSLRLMPLVPFWLINLAVGLTPTRVRTFAAVSFVGMLPGAFLFANAGTALAGVESAGDVLTWDVIGAFTLLAVVPLAIKMMLAQFGVGERS